MIVKIKKETVSKVIFIDDDKILLLKRANNLVDEQSPWTWDLPGGHLDKGESPRDAAIRETMEETQLKTSSLEYIGKDSNIGKLTYFYKTNEWSGDIKLSEEHSDYRWVDKSDLHDYRESIGGMYYKMIIKLF